MLAFDHRQADPSRAEHRAEMAMREQRDVAVHRPQTRDQAVDALADLGGRFAVRAAVAKDVPTRALARECRRSGGPRSRRSSTRRDRARFRADRRGPRVRRSRGRAGAGSSAHARTRSPSTQGRSARACVSPCGVSGMSVTPVCRPDSDHSVSPWRKIEQPQPDRGARRRLAGLTDVRFHRGRISAPARRAVAARAVQQRALAPRAGWRPCPPRSRARAAGSRAHRRTSAPKARPRSARRPASSSRSAARRRVRRSVRRRGRRCREPRRERRAATRRTVASATSGGGRLLGQANPGRTMLGLRIIASSATP